MAGATSKALTHVALVAVVATLLATLGAVRGNLLVSSRDSTIDGVRAAVTRQANADLFARPTAIKFPAPFASSEVPGARTASQWYTFRGEAAYRFAPLLGAFVFANCLAAVDPHAARPSALLNVSVCAPSELATCNVTSVELPVPAQGALSVWPHVALCESSFAVRAGQLHVVSHFEIACLAAASSGGNGTTAPSSVASLVTQAIVLHRFDLSQASLPLLGAPLVLNLTQGGLPLARELLVGRVFLLSDGIDESGRLSVLAHAYDEDRALGGVLVFACDSAAGVCGASPGAPWEGALGYRCIDWLPSGDLFCPLPHDALIGQPFCAAFALRVALSWSGNNTLVLFASPTAPGFGLAKLTASGGLELAALGTGIALDFTTRTVVDFVIQSEQRSAGVDVAWQAVLCGATDSPVCALLVANVTYQRQAPGRLSAARVSASLLTVVGADYVYFVSQPPPVSLSFFVLHDATTGGFFPLLCPTVDLWAARFGRCTHMRLGGGLVPVSAPPERLVVAVNPLSSAVVIFAPEYIGALLASTVLSAHRGNLAGYLLYAQCAAGFEAVPVSR